MRPVYRLRRDALQRALGRDLPELEPAGIAAGLHLVAWLPGDGARRERGHPGGGRTPASGSPVGVTPYRLTSGRPGLIFGYSNLSERAIADGVGRLARAIAGLRGGTSGAPAGT